MKAPRLHVSTQHHQSGSRPLAQYRFAIGGLALALAAGLGTPALARTLARAWELPLEPALVGVGFIVALGFLVAGWVLGRRFEFLHARTGSSLRASEGQSGALMIPSRPRFHGWSSVAAVMLPPAPSIM